MRARRGAGGAGRCSRAALVPEKSIPPRSRLRPVLPRLSSRVAGRQWPRRLVACVAGSFSPCRLGSSHWPHMYSLASPSASPGSCGQTCNHGVALWKRQASGWQVGRDMAGWFEGSKSRVLRASCAAAARRTKAWPCAGHVGRTRARAADATQGAGKGIMAIHASTHSSGRGARRLRHASWATKGQQA